MKIPRSSPWMSGWTTTTPSMTSDGMMVATWYGSFDQRSGAERRSVELDHRVVAQHEPQRPRAALRAGELDLAPDEAVGDAGHVDDAAPGEHDRVFDLGVHDLAPGRDRAERADVAVDDAGSAADDGGPEDTAVDDLDAGFDDHASLDRRALVDGPLRAALQRLEDQPVALQRRVLLAGVDPPAPEHVVVPPVAVVDQPLDGVGDLQLAPPRGLDRGDRLVDVPVEQVDAHQREVGRRV